MSGLLSGIRVLEIGHYIAGPHAAQMMADQGAEVIKVEPLSGDPSRKSIPVGQDNDSMLYATHNRGKRSIAIDLRSPDAPLALDPLLGWADLVITNYTAGVPERLGFGFAHLATLNPSAVMVHITGFDSNGAWRDYAAFDGSIVAMSGIAEMTGHEDGPPLLSHILFADHSVGAHAAFAATAALVDRGRTGIGRLVEINMLDVMTTYLGHHIATTALWNYDPTRSETRAGTRFVHLFPTAQGRLFVAAITPGQWRGFSTFVGHPEWAPRDMIETPDFLADPTLKDAAVAAGEAALAGMSAKQGMDRLQQLGVTCGVMRSVRDVYQDAVAAGSGTIHMVAYPDGTTVPVPAAAFESGAATSGTVASLGWDSATILADLDVSADTIGRLQAAGIIAVPEIVPGHTGRIDPAPPHVRHRLIGTA